TYLWEGDQPAEIREYRHNRLYSVRHLVFDGWQLLAQQVQFFTPNPENRHELIAGDMQTQYAVCAPTGEPLALFDTAGHRVWRRPPQSLYGLRLGGVGENAELNPGLKFAGQFLDDESGLVYNRYRYYSAVAGCYLTPDPIGLLGGENPYAYVENPTGWVDPFGLNALLPGEGGVGAYGKLPGVPGDDLTGHHMPSAEYMKQRFGKSKRETIAMQMEHKYPSNKGRHPLTRTYSRRPFLDETPREALARDIKDARKIYRDQGLYTKAIKKGLKETITQNKDTFPEIFKKPAKCPKP
ncbi:RHS repeat domain-containing protein, partial [Xenorhabdus szentirmaii]|uniref:RHS repeat domain-containing protein n=1 Tax=Xenorhabdus szentirmaii TaxID=290112 RepID=UPI0019C13EF6